MIENEVRLTLLRKRQLLLVGALDDREQEYLCSSILYLNAVSTDKITLLIDSTGGELRPELWTMDVVSASEAPVQAVVTGAAHSAAFGVLQASHHRMACAHASLLFHAPSTKCRCDQDVQKEFESVQKIHDEQIRAFARRSGQPEEHWRAWAKEEHRFDASEALALGMLDEIVPAGWR